MAARVQLEDEHVVDAGRAPAVHVDADQEDEQGDVERATEQTNHRQPLVAVGVKHGCRTGGPSESQSQSVSQSVSLLADADGSHRLQTTGERRAGPDDTKAAFGQLFRFFSIGEYSSHRSDMALREIFYIIQLSYFFSYEMYQNNTKCYFKIQIREYINIS